MEASSKNLEVEGKRVYLVGPEDESCSLRGKECGKPSWLHLPVGPMICPGAHQWLIPGRPPGPAQGGPLGQSQALRHLSDDPAPSLVA